MKSVVLAASLVVAAALPVVAGTITVTSDADRGSGSLREAIERANQVPGSTIEIAGGSDVVIVLERALPALRARGTTVNGGGATLREGKLCERSGRKKGCDGIVVAGANITVRNLRIAGFLLDGVAVRGPRASGVHIEDVHAIDNLDDGIGVSDGAGPVFIDRCILMGNGFRTKGKGILVFSDARATIRSSVVIANRDGVTVSRRAKAAIENTVVAGNYDKGIGASAAAVTGSTVAVLANGRERDAPAPNGDGVRVGLDGSVELERSLVAGNGDTGIVVLDTSRATLVDCQIEANGGAPTSVAATARLDQR